MTEKSKNGSVDMTTKYKYVAIYPIVNPGRPSGMMRIWSDAEGKERVESLRATLDWLPTDRLDPMARTDHFTYAEVDEAVVERFIEAVRQRHGGE
jgi:hypothetical protein